jgi:hypothetical protein
MLEHWQNGFKGIVNDKIFNGPSMAICDHLRRGYDGANRQIMNIVFRNMENPMPNQPGLAKEQHA